MRAAILNAPDAVPAVAEFPEQALAAGEVRGRVLAAGLHQLTRVHARGVHYSSHKQYPMIPGVDGVAELPDGRRAYFGWVRAPYGTFAELAAVPANAIPIGDVDPVVAAGMINPAMSSWLALRLRAQFAAGERVLVLGATGASGGLAVQIAAALGAGRVIAMGRSREKLAALSHARPIALDDHEGLARAAGEVDVVLDYLWGEPAAKVLAAIAHARPAHTVRYVNIGQSAGSHMSFDAHALRSIDLRMIGSGLGSVKPPEMFGAIGELVPYLPKLTLPIQRVPLDDIGEVWRNPPEPRVVIVP